MLLFFNHLSISGPSVGLIHQDDLGLNGLRTSDHNATTTTTSNKSYDSTDMATKQARVVMDYEAVNPQELGVKANDILIVYRLPGLDSDYVMAEKGGRRGRIPLSYLEII
uniref:SH3 domain-containing protein n=1 Tax=Panagrolaimus superbus TaxID=310955 RepID=A0A914YCR8_9BILA